MTGTPAAATGRGGLGPFGLFGSAAAGSSGREFLSGVTVLVGAELADQRFELGGEPCQLTGGLPSALGAFGGAAGEGGHRGDVLRDISAALGRLGDVAADLVGG